MPNLDSIITELLEETVDINLPNEPLKEVLNAYNIDSWSLDHNLKMIAWDQK